MSIDQVELKAPKRAVEFGVGLASPLWPTFFFAASAGVAYWAWSRWGRQAGETLAALPLLEGIAPPPADAFTPMAEIPSAAAFTEPQSFTEAKAFAEPEAVAALPELPPEPVTVAAPEAAPEPAPEPNLLDSPASTVLAAALEPALAPAKAVRKARVAPAAEAPAPVDPKPLKVAVKRTVKASRPAVAARAPVHRKGTRHA